MDRTEILLTPKEVAAILRIDRSTVYRLIRNRRLPSIRVGSDWRISLVKVRELMLTDGMGAPPKRKR